MARVSAFVAGVALGLAIGTAVVVSHAADPQQTDVVDAAAAANVDPQDLAAAVATVSDAYPGVTPWSYLRATGELPPLPPPAPLAAPIAPVWTQLAQCESSGNWHANTGNSYYGGLQEDLSFWRNHGGLAYAPRPDLASPAAQVAVAQRGLSVQGWAAWPACSRRLGLR